MTSDAVDSPVALAVRPNQVRLVAADAGAIAPAACQPESWLRGWWNGQAGARRKSRLVVSVVPTEKNAVGRYERPGRKKTGRIGEDDVGMAVALWRQLFQFAPSQSRSRDLTGLSVEMTRGACVLAQICERKPTMRHAKMLFTASLIGFAVMPAQARNLQTALFAGGCFWSVEKDFDHIKGVVGTVSGFAGGTVADPTYHQVTAGGTGHLETVQVTYDADIVSYEALVNEFFRMSDVTDFGGQFCDRGEHYLTAVFAASAGEMAIAQSVSAAAAAALGQEIATSILPAGPFYAAEDYHQNFYASQELVAGTGSMTKADRYKRYRAGCGRDARVLQLWGAEAFSLTRG